MDNKNNFSVPQNPFYELSKSTIDTYFILLDYFKNLREIKMLNKDGSLVMTNATIARRINRNTITAGRAIAKLRDRGLLKLEYIPDAKGEIRKIFVQSIENIIEQ